MSFAWFDKDRRDQSPAPRGAAPVGMITELPNVERAAILVLRLWCDGDTGRAKICEDFGQAFGKDRGQAAYHRLCHLIGLVVQGGRRALMRHGIGCACFGGDESAFANMVAAAAAGDRDDAMAFALVLMTPAAACAAIQSAEDTGLALYSLTRGRHGFSGPFDSHSTRH